MKGYVDQSRCAYCGDSFLNGHFVGNCPHDATPHHVACWYENQGCTTLGCPRCPVRSSTTGGILDSYAGFAPLGNVRNPLLDQALREGDEVTIYHFHFNHPNKEAFVENEPYQLDDLYRIYQEKYQRHIEHVVERINGKLRTLKMAIAADDSQGDDRAIEIAYDAVIQKLTPILQRQKLLGGDDIERIRLALKRMSAFREFETVLATNSHRAIAEAWKKNEELFRGFRLAESHSPLVRSAKQCVQTLDKIASHYAVGEWHEVIAVFDSWRDHFDGCKDYASYQTRVEDARRQIALRQLPELRQALEDGDDLKVNEIYVPSIFDGTLTPTEQQRAKLAVRRARIIRQMQEAFARNDWAHLVELYDRNAVALELKRCKAFTGEMRLAVVKARQELASHRLTEALKSGEASQIASAADAAMAAGYIPEESILRKIMWIKRRQAALERYRKASTDTEKLLVYDEELLGDATEISSEVAGIRQRRVPLWTLRQAIARKDIRTIGTLATHTKELEANLNEAERAYVIFARDMDKAIRDLEQALESRDVDAIARAYKAECDPFLTDFDKERVQSALAIRQYLVELKELSGKSKTAGDKVAIAQKYREAKANGVPAFDSLDWGIIQDALEFEARWERLKNALDVSDIDATFESWIPGRFHPYYQELSDAQRQRLWKTIRYVGARARLQQALDSRDPRRVASAYQPELLSEHSEVDQKLRQRAEELLRKTRVIQHAI